MDRLLGSDLWRPALEKYAEVTGLSVQLFGREERVVLATTRPSPIIEVFAQYGFEPGLFAECARRCLMQNSERPAIAVTETHGMTVVGTSLMLEGAIVGAAVAGYAFSGFSQIPGVQRWAKSSGVPFDLLWNIARRTPPVPTRRVLLYGELLQILGDALLRENHRAGQYEDAVVDLQVAAATKDEFLAMVSHELRTPLAPILGWASVLKNDQRPEVRQAALTIERNVLLQARMVDDLLDMTLVARGMVKLRLEIHELGACVRLSLETSAKVIEKKAIRLEIVDAGEPLLVEADGDRLQQIFGNIMSNAVLFTPVGGAIRVAITREFGSAKVVVTDTGVGIEPAFLPFVFEMFRQQGTGTRRQHQGLGIGLALVKRLTELHQGSVNITSAGTGRGTEVAVRIPLAAGQNAAATAAAVGAGLCPDPLAGNAPKPGTEGRP